MKTPIIKVLKIEETEYWCEDIVRRAPRIFGVYLFNASESVHCCELTPSYDCRFVATQYEEVDGLSDAERDALSEEIMSGDALSGGGFFDDCYIHCCTIDKFPSIQRGCFPVGKMGVYTLDDGTSDAAKAVQSGEETALDLMESYIEYGRGNSL